MPFFDHGPCLTWSVASSYFERSAKHRLSIASPRSVGYTCHDREVAQRLMLEVALTGVVLAAYSPEGKPTVLHTAVRADRRSQPACYPKRYARVLTTESSVTCLRLHYTRTQPPPDHPTRTSWTTLTNRPTRLFIPCTWRSTTNKPSRLKCVGEGLVS